jgi:capsid protein
MIAKTIGPDPTFNRIAAYDLSPPASRPGRSFGGPSVGFQESWRAAKRATAELSYRGAKPSRYRSSTPALGGTADAHYVHGLDYAKLREQAREFDREDGNVGAMFDLALDNILGAGLIVDPQPGGVDAAARKGLAQQIRDLWDAWAENPRECDWGGQCTFDELERLALRHVWVDGDAFFILDPRTGMVRFEEGDRVTSPDGQNDDTVHGVVLGPDASAPRGYLFSRLRPGDRKRAILARGVDLVEIPAEHVLHVHPFRRRYTQTRGITALAAVFDDVSMSGDINFARLVKLEVSACIAGFLETDWPQGFLFGGSDTQASGLDNGATDLEFGEFTPGMFGKLRRGEKFNGFSPSVTTADDSEFLEQVIRKIGLQIGFPLELALMVAKNQSFSALRGVVEQYKITARVKQRRISRVRSAVFRWKVAQWVEEGRLPNLPTIAKHTILCPTWPYIDPLVDSQADSLRVRDHLASRRQIWAERGRDYDQGVDEMADDDAALCKAYQERAKSLGVPVELLLSIGSQAPMPAQQPQPKAGEQPAKGAA